jgi:hypothetical protein
MIPDARHHVRVRRSTAPIGTKLPHRHDGNPLPSVTGD